VQSEKHVIVFCSLATPSESHGVTLVPVANRKKDVPSSCASSLLDQDSLLADDSCWEEMDMSAFDEAEHQAPNADQS